MRKDFVVVSEGFEKVVASGSSVEKVADGLVFTEGPVWFSNGDFLLFSDINGNRIMRWSDADGLTEWRSPSGYVNGNTLDRHGRLVTAGHVSREVTRTELDGSITVLADSYQGKRLNAPNDVVVKSDGTIWFTDPGGGRGLPGYEDVPTEQPTQQVFRLDPDSRVLDPVLDDMQWPNGLCFSLDESQLYIADSKSRHIRVFDVTVDNALVNGRIFANIAPGFPDGIRLDRDGRVYSTADDGIHVFNGGGDLIGKILVEQTPSNCTFGGLGKRMLYITAQTAVYRVALTSTGAQEP